MCDHFVELILKGLKISINPCSYVDSKHLMKSGMHMKEAGNFFLDFYLSNMSLKQPFSAILQSNILLRINEEG